MDPPRKQSLRGDAIKAKAPRIRQRDSDTGKHQNASPFQGGSTPGFGPPLFAERVPTTPPASPPRDDRYDPPRGRTDTVDFNGGDSVQRALSPVAEPLGRINNAFNRRREIEADMDQKLDAMLQNKGGRVRKLETENAMLKKKVEELETEAAIRAQQGADTAARLNKLLAVHEEQAREQERLTANVRRIQDERDAALAQAAEMNKKLDELNRAHDAASQDAKGLRSAVDDYKRKLEAAEAKADKDKKKHKEAIRQLEERLREEVGRDKKALESQLSSLSDRNKQLATEKQALEGRVAQLVAAAGESQVHVEKAARLEEKVAQLEDELAAVLERENMLAETVDGLQTELVRLESNNQAKMEQIQDWQDRYNELASGLGDPGRRLRELAEELKAGEARMEKMREKIALLTELV